MQKASHDVVVSTYGRGRYIMDDITPIEHGMMESSFTEPVALAAPRTAFREIRGGSARIAKNPIDFEVIDSEGALVAKLPRSRRMPA
jgi:hypothetical protein